MSNIATRRSGDYTCGRSRARARAIILRCAAAIRARSDRLLSGMDGEGLQGTFSDRARLNRRSRARYSARASSTGESTRALFASRSLANDQPLVKSPARHLLPCPPLICESGRIPDGYVRPAGVPPLFHLRETTPLFRFEGASSPGRGDLVAAQPVTARDFNGS